jgi:hypothetical protein
MQTDRLLTLKVWTDEPVVGRDVLTLFGPKITNYARQHIETISRYIDSQLHEIAERDRPLLKTWQKDPSVPRHPLALFNGVPLYFQIETTPEYGFSYSSRIAARCTALTRQAENALREDAGLPHVGEGWVAETNLYFELVAAFPDHEVSQHASPEWLGRQHLDVFIPTLSVALEYQGEQHDRPIDYFGGQAAFQRTQERDAKKRRLCKRHGVRLIEVRPGYRLSDIVSRVLSA